MFEQSLIDQVRESVNIVDVIQSYIPLKKAGSGFKALCPFHDEDTPSFNVSEKKQIFKCFGCGKSGNVFTFVQEYEKISFPEAVRRLAQRGGVHLPEQGPKPPQDEARDALFRACDLAAAFYRHELSKDNRSDAERTYLPGIAEHSANPERMNEAGRRLLGLSGPGEARRYLSERDISDATQKAFDIGYAPNDYDALANHLRGKGISDDDMIRAGLRRQGERGSYDLLRHRLIFPIRNANGRVVAFGGRILSKDQQGGKYVNSPTSDIYTKGDELYGLYQARYEINKQTYAVMCEGYTDLIRLHECGFKHAVASLGTALTERQVHLLGRYAKRIVLLYDGDKAGRQAAMKAGLIALQQGFEVNVCALPPDQDPDSFLLAHGAEALDTLLKEAPGLPAFVRRDEVMGISQRAKVDVLRNAMQQITSELARELFAQEVAQAFGISVTSLLTGVSQRRERKKAKKDQFFLAKNQWERECIRFMVQQPEKAEILCASLKNEYFFDEQYRALYEAIARNPGRLANAASLLNDVDEETVRNLLGELLMDEAPVFSEPEIVGMIRQRTAQLELELIEEELALASQESPEFLDLLRRKRELQQVLQRHDRRKVTRTLF